MISTPYKGASLDLITQTYHPEHPALDMVFRSLLYPWSYGVPLCAPENSEVIGIRGDVYDPSNYNDEARGFSIWLKGKETGCTHFFHHLQPVLPTKIGDQIKRGQIVAFMGNSGLVRRNGIYVPLEQRTTPPYPGSHVHYEMYDEKYKLGAKKRFLNPLDFIDWNSGPTYTTTDHLKALLIVKGKAVGLLNN